MAEEVAEAIARLIEHPTPEMYTNPAHVAAFEAGR
jgi:hypothetical protein